MKRESTGRVDDVASANAEPPGNIPAIWIPLFEEFTGVHSQDKWGLRAAIFIAHYRKRCGFGPTFAQLFTHLEQDLTAHRVPSQDPIRDQRQGLYAFRYHVAVHWRRLGWINWDRGARSLRVGKEFRSASREWKHGQNRETP